MVSSLPAFGTREAPNRPLAEGGFDLTDAELKAGLVYCRCTQGICPTTVNTFCEMSMQNAASLRTATQTGQTLLLNCDTAFRTSCPIQCFSAGKATRQTLRLMQPHDPVGDGSERGWEP